jgi:hypothetical protein
MDALGGMRMVDAMTGGHRVSVEMADLAGRIASRDLFARDARYAFLILLQAIDVATTTLVLSWGGTEQNPLAEILTSAGPSGLIALLLLKFLLVLRLHERGINVRLVTAIYAVVVTNNLFFVAVYLTN